MKIILTSINLFPGYERIKMLSFIGVFSAGFNGTARIVTVILLQCLATLGLL